MTMNLLPKNFFCGLSGLELPVPKYQFPLEFQKASRLTYYATFFNSIEVNSSFYRIPMASTIKRWAASVPEDFKFTFKLFRELTHVKNLDYDVSSIAQFIETISWVGDKRACLLVQFPPSLKNTHYHELERLLKDIRNADHKGSWKVAVEFRDAGWYNDDVFDLLDAHGATLVIQDIPKSATPLTNLSADFLYVRFHGPTGNYRGSYPDAFLHEYAEYITDWLTGGRTIYLYFNNTAGDAFKNLITLKKSIQA